MDRRGFLKFFSAGVAGIALERAIPLGRVWSFPKEIVVGGVDYAFGLDATVIVARTFRIPQRFEIGDIVSLPAFGSELYCVSHLREDGGIEIVNGHGAGVVTPSALRCVHSHLASAPSAPGLPAGPVEIGPRLATRRNS